MRKRYIYCGNIIPCFLEIEREYMFYSPKYDEGVVM